MDGQAIKATLGKNIKFLRFRREFSQADLAEKAEISIIFLSNIERGVKFPMPDVLARIAKALDVEVYELFKTSQLPVDTGAVIDQLSEDLTRKVNQAITAVFTRYKGEP
jgi:transcriptional regulator with XRE-family HTH domain